jgi:hypothetical protein
MSKTRIDELQSLVTKLQADRNGHMDAIAQIDAAFEAFGITASKATKRGRGKKKAVAKKKTAKTTKRKKFRMTASELILTTIQKSGAKGATGAQIGKAWKAAGRPGSVYKTLGSLVKNKKFKRVKIKGAKGSLYR